MREPINEYAQRTMRYWYVDGLSEIAVGVVVMLLAFVFLIGTILEPGPTTDLFIAFGQPVIVLAGAVAARRVVSKLKERVTYPRTGYVEYRRPRGHRRIRLIAMAMGIAAAFAIVFGILQNIIQPRWIPGISGAVIALLLVYLAYENGIRRFYIMALYTLFLGLLVASVRLADMYATPLFFGSFGLGWILCGSLTLRHYLDTTKPARGNE
jgi:amino acid permease